jgi:hypothetical protein
VCALALALAGCIGGGAPGGEPPPERASYLKLNVSRYAGAAADPGAPPATARGTRYQSGTISSAAADWSRFPAGTVFRVLATRELFEVDDYTDDIVGTNTILLYKPAVANLPAATTHYVTIEIVKWGSPRESAAMLKTHTSSTAKRILKALLERYPQR